MEEFHNQEEKNQKKKTFTAAISSSLKNKFNLAFLGVLLISIMIRIKYFFIESLWNDAAVHLWFAIKATRNPLFLFSRDYLLGDHVLPQTVTAFFYLFTGDAFIAGKIMTLLFGVIGIVFMYLLGTEIKNKFTGLIAAALFGLNHLLWFYGVRPLADSPLTVMVVLILYFFVKLEKEHKLIWGILLALTFLAAMFTKKQAAVFFGAYLLYLILFKRKDAIKNKSVLISWLTPTAILTAASLIFKNNFFFSLINRILLGAGLKDGSILTVFNHLKWIFSGPMLVLVVLGILLIILYKKKEYYFPAILFAFYSLYLEIGVRTVEDRIVLPVLSAGILLSVFSLTEIGHYISILVKKRWVKPCFVILVTIFICWNSYKIGDQIISQKAMTYLGHHEAGTWIKENVPLDTPLFAGSPRIVRAFAEREYGGPSNWDRGGSLWYLRDKRYVENQSAFEEDLKKLANNSEVYLEIDIWEYDQPKWYWPITQESINYFQGLGFNLVNVVEREVSTQQGLQKMPVIFLFKMEMGEYK